MFALSNGLRRAAWHGLVAVLLLLRLPIGAAQEPRPGLPAPLDDLAPKVALGQAAPTERTNPLSADQDTAAEKPKSAWLDSPLVHPFSKVGNGPIVPQGAGYYSLRDWLRGDFRDAPPKCAYPPFALMPPPFYDADFRYVDAPGYQPMRWEEWHRIHLGDNWLFGTGGSAWWRHMHEFNSRLTGKTNDYDLVRARVFGDLWYRDRFRIYAEFITAIPVNQDLPPLRIDENRADLLNLFIDVKIGEFDCRPVYLRVGRQELSFGSQRLISALDWANTRRTFEGVRGFWLGEKVDVDLFWVQPVTIDNSRFDYPDRNVNFAGAWVSYRPEKKEVIDLYYLYLDNHNQTVSKTLNLAPTLVHTLGARSTGDRDGFLWDYEGMLQLGENRGNPITAGAATAGIGYNWAKGPMNPTVWAYYDWASGDPSPNAGNYNTFNQLLPFGHYYLGFIDLVGRQNIRDWNLHLYLNPTKWVTFNAQYHFFQLDRARDALYAANGVPLRLSAGGNAGGVVGQELDLIVNFHMSRTSDFLVGYSKLNAGEFISNTGPGRSPELFYLMYNVRW